MPTITDVSRKAGVSRSTVSRLIAGNGYVSESARQAVEAAIAELGYRPNTMARGLRSNRSNLIGGVVVNVASPFYAQMVGGIQETCRSASKSFLVASGYADKDQEARAIIELIDRGHISATERAHSLEPRHSLLQQFETLPGKFDQHLRQAGRVAPRPREARDHSRLDRIRKSAEYNRDRARVFPRRLGRKPCRSEDHIGIA